MKCKRCGTEFEHHGSRKRVFCSRKCNHHYHALRSQKRARDKKRGHVLPKTVVCKYCGKETTTKTHNKKFCSSNCCKKYNYTPVQDRKNMSERTYGLKDCDMCGDKFTLNSPTQKRCIVCRKKKRAQDRLEYKRKHGSKYNMPRSSIDKFNERRRRERAEKRIADGKPLIGETISCLYCSKKFKVKKDNHLYCSDTCCRKGNYWLANYGEMSEAMFELNLFKKEVKRRNYD